MKFVSTASWEGVQIPQPKFTRTATSKNAVTTHKSLVLKAGKSRQSSEEYLRMLEVETLSRVLQLELHLGRAPTINDLLEYFAKSELDLVWDSVLMYYPDIYSSLSNLTQLSGDGEVAT